jgi:hypothetical protein
LPTPVSTTTVSPSIWMTQLWIAMCHWSVSGSKKSGTNRSALSCHPDGGVRVKKRVPK